MCVSRGSNKGMLVNYQWQEENDDDDDNDDDNDDNDDDGAFIQAGAFIWN